MRTILRIGLALALVLAAAFAVATVVVNQRTAEAIERHTASALGVPASLDRAAVSLLTGGFTLGGLDVTNPEGFDAPRAMRVGSGDGRIRLTTFFGEVVEMPRLTLGDLELHLERRGGAGNYEAILGHYLREGRGTGDPDRRYVIDELVIRDVTVHLDLLPQMGEAARLSVPIDEIRLTGVGEEGADRGLVLQEVVGVVVRAVLAAVLERAAEELPGIVARELAERLGELLERDP